jgi:hypothetical protein
MSGRLRSIKHASSMMGPLSPGDVRQRQGPVHSRGDGARLVNPSVASGVSLAGPAHRNLRGWATFKVSIVNLH